MQSLNLRTEVFGGKYLGLPTYLGRSKTDAFEYIKEIQGWKERLISKAGKEILIKVVAQAIPTYAMSFFDLMKDLCDSLKKMSIKCTG